MSKRIFDMGRAMSGAFGREELLLRFTRWPEEAPRKPSTEEMEIRRLKEVLREKDAYIAKLERQCGLRR